MTRLEIIEILKKYKNENAKKYGINTLGLFGSYSKGKGKDVSDVDIVIEIKVPDMIKLVHIKEELEELLSKNVDIVRIRKRMNPYLKKHIEKDAVYV